MTTRGQNLRSTVPGNVPTAGTRLPGELWVNFPDLQLGVIDTARAAQKLIAVRFFSATANYAAGDFIIQAGKLYFAKAAIVAGAFNATQWTQVAALTDIPAVYTLPTASTSVLGGVMVDGATIRINSGVISSVGLVTVSATPPSPVQNGALWYDLIGGQLYAWINDGTSNQWVIAVNAGGGGGASISIGDAPPAGPLIGALWFDSVGGQMYVWMNDGNSNQWVPATNQMGGGYLPSKGVVDGSDAAPGQIGEIISSNVTTNVPFGSSTAANITSISLTPGDWDVQGEVWAVPSAAGGSAIFGGIATVSATIPLVSSLATTRNQTVAALQAGSIYTLPFRPCRVSLSAATTYYLVGQCNGAAGNGTGNLWARRVR